MPLSMWQYLFIYLEDFAYRSIFICIYKNVSSPFSFLLFKRKIKFTSTSVSFSSLYHYIKACQNVRLKGVIGGKLWENAEKAKL